MALVGVNETCPEAQDVAVVLLGDDHRKGNSATSLASVAFTAQWKWGNVNGYVAVAVR